MPRDIEGEREARQAHSELRSALRFAFLGMPEMWPVVESLWINRISIRKTAENLKISRRVVEKHQAKARLRIEALRLDPLARAFVRVLSPNLVTFYTTTIDADGDGPP